MDKSTLLDLAADFMRGDPGRVPEDLALRPALAGMRMFADPIAAVADAADPAFSELRNARVVGPHFTLPSQWLPGARSVISIFFPFSGEVLEANRVNMAWPAQEWLHARVEGQAGLERLAQYLIEAIKAAWGNAVCPCLDSRFWSKTRPEGGTGYTSNWSERHVAYVCGLGTFGLSAGLITEKGIAGRFLSLVTDLELPADERPYTAYDEYCTKCGACARSCPAGAIAVETGKDHVACSWFLDKVREAEHPRYGCGKCQVGVPCQSKIPRAVAATHA